MARIDEVALPAADPLARECLRRKRASTDSC